jgi:DNA-binding MarR family transcriptional regulator
MPNIPETKLKGNGSQSMDRESAASEHDHTSLRLWLRLLTCTTLIENLVRTRLRTEYETTLPRFDLMAQLARYPDGLKMGELSKMMMVTGGNVTGITDQLERDGLVERVTPPNDRRAWQVRLTPKGRETFEAMAALHEGWIVDWMDSLTVQEQQQLYVLLGKLKQGVREKT